MRPCFVLLMLMVMLGGLVLAGCGASGGDAEEYPRECDFGDVMRAQSCHVSKITRDPNFEEVVIAFAEEQPRRCVQFALSWKAQGSVRTGAGPVPIIGQYTKRYEFRRTAQPRIKVPPYHDADAWLDPEAVGCTSYPERVRYD